MKTVSGNLLLLVACGLLLAGLLQAESPRPALELDWLGRYSQPNPAAAFDRSAAEIVAFDVGSQRLYVTNGHDQTVDILDVRDPARATLVAAIDITVPDAESAFRGGGANSVAVANGVVAVAIEAADAVSPGVVALFDAEGKPLALYQVGAMPDMLLFTEDGNTILVANEGEPQGDIDPEGSVSVIDISAGPLKGKVRTADFHHYDSQVKSLRRAGVRLFPNVAVPPLRDNEITVSQDLEPEYIALSGNGNEAMVVLQEANTLAVLEISTARISALRPMGSVSYLDVGVALDPSDRDGGIHIRHWPLRGLYMPDGLASYKVGGKTWYISANEGDDRGSAMKPGRGDAVRYKSISKVSSFGRNGLAEHQSLSQKGLAVDESLGRLVISSIDGLDAEGKLTHLYTYGSRSFSVLDHTGEMVWDSGDQLERITAARFAPFFNATSTRNRDKKTDEIPGLDARSPQKGPEPEAVATARLFGRHYAFIGLERVGGVVIYDVTEPHAPHFVNYVNNRDFDVSNDQLERGLAGDLGPESLLVISATNSPTARALLVVANEVSGSISFYNILPAPDRKN